MTLRLPRPILTLVFLSALGAQTASAGKLDLDFGGFQFSAVNKRNDTSKSISGVGAYHIGYRHAVTDHYELDVGYSLLATKVLGGDLSFGFDLGINYFPFTPSGPIKANNQGATAIFHQQWRPFTGLMFSQRNFQSTSSQYAGAGFKIGTEYQLSDPISAQMTAEYRSLGGPNASQANQINILAGLVWQF